MIELLIKGDAEVVLGVDVFDKLFVGLYGYRRMKFMAHSFYASTKAKDNLDISSFPNKARLDSLGLVGTVGS